MTTTLLQQSFILVLVLSAFYKPISQAIKKKLRVRLTALDDLPLLLDVRAEEDKIQGTAVICGGSIAGLVASRVCSNHFKRVIIIEPEEWVTTEGGLQYHHNQLFAKETPSPKRSHVAQYNAVHIYHGFVTLMFRRLFPQLEREFGRNGARIAPLDVKMHLSGVPILSPDHDYPGGQLTSFIFATRPLFETTLRRMVIESCPNVTYQSGRVIGLVRGDYSMSQLAGVKVKSRSGEERQISASLIIDCTGPAFGGWHWLQDLSPVPNGTVATAGSPPSPSLRDLRVTYDHKVAYTNCLFDVPPRIFDMLKGLGFPENYEQALNLYMYVPSGKETTVMFMQRRENNLLHIACGGWGVRDRITSTSDLRTSISQLVPRQPFPDWIFAMLDLFEQEDVPATFTFARCPPAVYIQYHRAKDLPSNFIAIGDAGMQSNPAAAHGCVKACVEATTLNALLARCVGGSSRATDTSKNILPSDFSQKFFAAQARRTGHVWESSKTTDYRHMSTIPETGEDLGKYAWKRAYLDAIMRLSTEDVHVAGILYQASNWLIPVTDMFSPIIIWKVLWLKIRDIMAV